MEHSTAAMITFFSSAYGTWSRKDHILVQLKAQLKGGNHAMYLFLTERYEIRNQEYEVIGNLTNIRKIIHILLNDF